jgi:RNase P subunit RPR2
MNDKTLVFLHDQKNVLLAMKKKGFGQGWWNGYGGKIEKNESITQAAIRELEEESGIQVNEKELNPMGKIEFIFIKKKEWNQTVHLFSINKIEKAVETKEMKPKIFEKQKIPFKQMWDGDNYWIPLLLENKKIEATLEFKGKGKFSKIIFEKPFKKTITKKEKTTGKQKLALERIYKLFELAEEMNNSNRKDKEIFVKRYLKLAKKIGEKTNTKIPKELKKKFCKKCFLMNIQKIEQKPFLITKCEKCGFEKKYFLE